MINRLLFSLLFCCGMYSGFAQTFSQGALCDSLRGAIKKDIGFTDVSGAVTPSYYQYVRDGLSLDRFAQIMLVVDPSIDSIKIDLPSITVYGDYQKRFAREGGYGMIYRQFHDLYASLFSFSQIDVVSVFDCWKDCRNITYLPIKSDEYLTRMENAIFHRSWYIPELDYYRLIGPDRLTADSSFNEKGEFLSILLKDIVCNYKKESIGPRNDEKL